MLGNQTRELLSSALDMDGLRQFGQRRRFSALLAEPFRSPYPNSIAGLKLLGLSFSLPGASNGTYSRVSKIPAWIFPSLKDTMHRQVQWGFVGKKVLQPLLPKSRDLEEMWDK